MGANDKPSGTNDKPAGTKDRPDGRVSRTEAGGSAGLPSRPGDASSSASAPAARSSSAEVADFLAKMKAIAPAPAAGRGRLVFAMDATMSRAPTWDMALGLQADMFRAVAEIGTLDVQLVYFRGAGECGASRWVSDATALAGLMGKVECRGGYTQIGKVLSHARSETGKSRVNALVYVGDCMEEDIDELAHRAGELGLLGVPVFLFQEGRDAKAERAFREIARLTGGAWCPFDQGSAEELRQLLAAVAVYAAGGRKALARLADEGSSRGARLMIEQMGKREG